MIRLKSIKADNFLSFKELSLTFESGLYLINGFNHDENTANGSGKSSVMDAICFGLYGDLPRKIRIDEITKWGEVGTEVTTVFSKGQNVYTIVRSRNPNKLDFFINNQKNNGKDAKETQARIEGILGLGFSAFLYSVYFSQNSSIGDQFLFVNDEAKKDIFTELLGLGALDECYEEIRKDLKTIEDAKMGALKEVDFITRSLNEQKALIEQYRQLSSNFERLRSEDVKSIEAAIKNIKTQQKNALRSYKESIAISECVPNLHDAIEHLKDKIDPLVGEKFSKHQIERAYKVKEIDLLKKQHKRAKDLLDAGDCPTCGQKIAAELFSGPLVQLEKEIGQLEKDVASLDVTLGSLKSAVDNNLIYNDEIIKLNNKIVVSQKLVAEAQRSYQNNESFYGGQVSDLTNKLEKAKTATNHYEGLILETEGKMGDLEGKMAAQQEKLTQVQYLSGIYDVLYLAFGKEGLKSHVFNQLINELNVHITGYLRQLFDNTIDLRLNSQTITSANKVKNRVDTILTIDGVDRNIHLLSGGERARLSLATNFALSKIIASRTTSVNFLCLDEGLTGLDLKGKEKIMEFLRKLSANKDFIYVIDHESVFKEGFDGVYNVEKRNGTSEVII